MSAQISPVYCPVCKQSDKVTSASAANVSAPLKPSDASVQIIKIMRIIFGSLFGILVAVFLCGIVLTLCSIGLAGASDSSGLGALMTGTLAIPFFCFAPIALVLGGLFTVGLPWFIARFVNESYQRQHTQWQKAMDKWNKLYYCTRDAGVFLEGQARLVPLEQMRSFLYEIEPSQAPVLHGI